MIGHTWSQFLASAINAQVPLSLEIFIVFRLPHLTHILFCLLLSAVGYINKTILSIIVIVVRHQSKIIKSFFKQKFSSFFSFDCDTRINTFLNSCYLANIDRVWHSSGQILHVYDLLHYYY